MQLPLPLPEASLLGGGSPPRRPERRIYCNRTLRLDHIDAVGFDMDYTLATYRQAAMDRLGVQATVDKLVARGYPEALRHARYPTDFAVRGLLIDRKLGNVLKMDRYGYVKRAYHGLRRLSTEERRRIYHMRRVRRTAHRYHWVDTLYALAEATVYAIAVEVLEPIDPSLSYERLFADVRDCIDRAHQDGSILDPVRRDLPRYIERDLRIGRALHAFRSSGKRLFLLTNSHAEYTDRVMSYLFDGALPEYPSWRNYFDFIVTAARKPRFFTHREPFVPVGPGATAPTHSIERGRAYQGGNRIDLQDALDTTPDRVLYIGDHIYGDVLRAKKSTAWRTAMIIQEMDHELRALDESAPDIERLDTLETLDQRLRDALRGHQQQLKDVERRLDRYRAAANGAAAPEPGLEPRKTDLDASRSLHRRAIDRLRLRLHETSAEIAGLEHAIEHRYHPYWGSIFKAGGEVSTFGDQVEAYACLYTTRVSNFAEYSPMGCFQSPRDRMPHEL